MSDYKPSQVVLGHPPLVGTMKHSEVEHAAALIVGACAHLGDKWQSITPRQLGGAIMELIEAKVEPWDSLNTNPFFRPDPLKLSMSEYATIDDNKAIAFTDAGFEAMKRWVPTTKP